MDVREIEINKGEYLTDVFKREGYPFHAVPTNCVFDKTIPGLGATHSEIKAERHSIIIEPNIPVIVGKASKDKKLLAVYEKQSEKKIAGYFTNDKIVNKKILCTPESYMKVRRIAQELGVDLYHDYFCLFDECEKITQDIDYRNLIALPVKDFFLYTNKAFVSATPVTLRNPDFERFGFFKLKIRPTFEYKKKLELIVTNSYEKTIIEKFDELKDSPCICVFLNSTNGINKLITFLEKKGISNYKAFCSNKSVLKFKDRGIHSFEDLDLPLVKYNFFTSRFFSAVDIFNDKKPDILILTDLNEAKYSRIDPWTNAIQIYGRFRTGLNEGNSFNSLTHITNVNAEETVLVEPEIETYLDESEKVYNALNNRLLKMEDKGRKLLLTNDLHKLTYNQFINTDRARMKNYFAIDNFYDDERVKGFYLSATNLEQAYIDTNHFEPTLVVRNEIIGDKELLHYKRLPSKIQIRKYIVEILDSLYLQVNATADQIEYAKNQFRKNDNRERAEVANHIIDAYEKLGGDAIRNTGFNKNPIDLLLKSRKKGVNKDKMKSPEVLEAIKQKFTESEYLEVEAIRMLQEIFNQYGIDIEAKYPTIGKYFGVTKLKGKDKKGFIKLWKFQPDFDND